MTTTKVGTIYTEARLDSSKMRKDLDTSRSQVKTSTQKMQNSFMNLKRIAITAFAGWGVKAAIGSVVNLGREFESSMKTVQAWSGASGQDLKRLTNVAREMGSKTEWSANQAAGALKYLAAAGFTVDQSIKALPGTLDLATAGQVDLATSADITTDVLTAFGMQVDELNRVNDAFVTTTSNSNTNIMMLGQSMKMVAPTAKLMGLNIEQTAALLGTLANAGVKAEMAGSGLNMVMLRSSKAAKMLGMDAMSPLIDVLKRMKEEQWDATKIGEAFGARQVKTAGILMENLGNYEDLTKKIYENKGATSELAAIVRDSLDNDLKILSSTIQEEMLKVFDATKDDLRALTQETVKWIKSMGPEAISSIKNFVSIIEDVVYVYKGLPSGIGGATGTGLIVGILGRSSVIGAIAGALVLLNKQMEEFGLNIGSLGSSREFSEAIKNIVESLRGIRDWNTGALKGEKFFPFPKDLPTMAPLMEKYKKTIEPIPLITDEWMFSQEELNKALDDFDFDLYATDLEKQKKLIEDIAISKAKSADVSHEQRMLEHKYTQATAEDYSQLNSDMKKFREEDKTDYLTWADARTHMTETMSERSRDALSDIFFGTITGELNSLADIWDGVWRAMLRTLTDIVAQMIVEWALFKNGLGLGTLANELGFSGLAQTLGVGGAGSSVAGGGGAVAGAAIAGGGAAGVGATTGIATTGSLTTGGGATYGAVSGAGTATGMSALGPIAAVGLSVPLLGPSITGWIADVFGNRGQGVSPMDWLNAYLKGIPAGTDLGWGQTMKPDSFFNDFLVSTLLGHGIGGGSPIVDIIQSRNTKALKKLGAWSDRYGLFNLNPIWNKYGSFKYGTSYVPYDMLAYLHKGEKVTKANQDGSNLPDQHIYLMLDNKQVGYALIKASKNPDVREAYKL